MTHPKLATARIYGLHSGDGVIRYVGQTRRELRTRVSQHRSEAKKTKTYNTDLHEWIRSVDLHGKSLEVTDAAYLDAREAYWIGRLPNLLNRTTGGASAFSVSPETALLRSAERNHFFGQRFIGDANPFFGRHHEEAARALVSGSRNAMAKLTREQVDEIIRRQSAGEVQKNLAKEFGVGPMTISRIVRGLRWGNGLS